MFHCFSVPLCSTKRFYLSCFSDSQRGNEGVLLQSELQRPLLLKKQRFSNLNSQQFHSLHRFSLTKYFYQGLLDAETINASLGYIASDTQNSLRDVYPLKNRDQNKQKNQFRSCKKKLKQAGRRLCTAVRSLPGVGS